MQMPQHYTYINPSHPAASEAANAGSVASGVTMDSSTQIKVADSEPTSEKPGATGTF
jgi:hypothetical protein